jgi:hypothetical protein
MRLPQITNELSKKEQEYLESITSDMKIKPRFRIFFRDEEPQCYTVNRCYSNNASLEQFRCVEFQLLNSSKPS